MNLKWDKLLKRIVGDPESFIYEEGGWKSFADGDSENGEADDDEDGECDSDFASQEFKEVNL